MVGTRSNNKNVHPAAPLMTEAARVKAGIPSGKRRAKKVTKDERIRELQARLAAAENPHEAPAVSKEPLVSQRSLRTQTNSHHTTQFTRDGSPPEDADPYAARSETPTEVDSDEFMIVGGKRTLLSDLDPRCVTRRNQRLLAHISSIYFIHPGP